MENSIEITTMRCASTAMYKRTAKSKHRQLLKSNDYMPSLNTLSERNGKGGMWAPEHKEKKRSSKAKADQQRNFLFGKRIRD